MIDLSWRNINTDQLFDDMYDNGKMTVTISGSRVLSDSEKADLKQMPGFKQLTRLQIFIAAMEEALGQDPNSVVNGNLVEFPLEQIYIGDLPFVFPIMPKTHVGLLQLSAIIPISKSKLYLRNIDMTGLRARVVNF